MRSSLLYYSSSLLGAIMGWINGSLPGWDDWASWLPAPSGVVGNRYAHATYDQGEARSITAFRREADMSSLLPLLLHWVHEYRYPMLWLTVFIAAVGIPLPIGLVLLVRSHVRGSTSSAAENGQSFSAGSSFLSWVGR
jgi:hypothetical protein